MWEYILLAVIVIGIIWYLIKKIHLGLQKSIINEYFGTSVTGNAEKLFQTQIVGIKKENRDASNRQILIKKHLSKSEYLLLKKEKNNKHNENAIAVYITDNTQLGYIPTEQAAILSKQIDSGAKIFARVNAIKGDYNGNTYGVIIDILKG